MQRVCSFENSFFKRTKHKAKLNKTQINGSKSSKSKVDKKIKYLLNSKPHFSNALLVLRMITLTATTVYGDISGLVISFHLNNVQSVRKKKIKCVGVCALCFLLNC